MKSKPTVNQTVSKQIAQKFTLQLSVNNQRVPSAELRSSVQQISTFYGTRIFTTVFTTGGEWKLCGSDKSNPYFHTPYIYKTFEIYFRF
jgi:hypothetical protein